MKKIFFVIILSIFSIRVFAQSWMKIEENNLATLYIDKSTIKKTGDFRRFWELQDRKTSLSQGIFSFRAYTEIDCNQERTRNLQLTAFPEHMAKGLPELVSDTPDEWRFVAPETMGRGVLDFVCKK